MISTWQLVAVYGKCFLAVWALGCFAAYVQYYRSITDEMRAKQGSDLYKEILAAALRIAKSCPTNARALEQVIEASRYLHGNEWITIGRLQEKYQTAEICLRVAHEYCARAEELAGTPADTAGGGTSNGSGGSSAIKPKEDAAALLCAGASAVNAMSSGDAAMMIL